MNITADQVPPTTVDQVGSYHKERIAIDSLTGVGRAVTEKEMLDYTPTQVRNRIVKYTGDFTVESLFYRSDLDQMTNLLLDLNDSCDIWLAYFADVRSQLVDWAGEGHHQHSYYGRLALNKSCSSEPNIDGIDRWPFLDEAIANFDGLIAEVANYMSPRLTSPLEYRREHEEHYEDMTAAVKHLGYARYKRHPRHTCRDDQEALLLGVTEMIRAATYVGDLSVTPTGIESKKELLFDRSGETLLSEMEHLLHNL